MGVVQAIREEAATVITELLAPVADRTRAPQLTRDRWGNVILSAAGPLGQYRIRSWWCGAVHLVCGAPGQHAHEGHWLDDVTANGQGMRCWLCWPRALDTWKRWEATA